MHACMHAMLCYAQQQQQPPPLRLTVLTSLSGLPSVRSTPNPTQTQPFDKPAGLPPIPSHPIPSRGPRALPLAPAPPRLRLGGGSLACLLLP